MISFLPLIPLAYFGARLSIIDFKTHRLPNHLVGWFTATQILIMGITSWITSDLARLTSALGIAGVTTIIYLLLYLVSRGSLGMGDVKLAFPLGLCVGWYSANQWLLAIFVSFLLAGLVAVIGLLTKRITRKSRLAFGPYMFLGTLIVCGFAVYSQ
jgi:leader peptidase (prepilin peptidase) / N-methyltransferase